MGFGDLDIPVNTQNRDPRIACILLLDVSGSMTPYIRDLEAGFQTFIDDLQGDPLARKRAEISVITFGDTAQVVVPFQEARTLTPLKLHQSGSTNMADAITLALDELAHRKAQYTAETLEYFRPWLFVLTDGAPNAAGFDAAVKRLTDAEAAKGVSVFGVGVGGSVNWEQLGRLSRDRVAVHMDGLAFTEMFLWLSASLSSVSTSGTHGIDEASIAGQAEQVALPSPQGWAKA
jgi:uncharacterized protein YegL